MTARPLIVGDEAPTDPYPIFLSSAVVSGYGRGSKELGIPTANMNDEAQSMLCHDAELGIYYGWAQVLGVEKSHVLPMVMSLGWNPFYKNQKRSAEVHIIHTFPQDFYGQTMRVAILGYIRPEQNYDSVDALVEDIQTDIKVALNSLDRPQYQAIAQHEFFHSTTA